METGITSSPSPSPASGTWENERQIRDFQRATLNILEDSELERKRLEIMQTATLNILEDFAEERSRFTQVQTATLNILEDFAEEKFRYAQVQTATLNILEDFDEEKQRLQQSQSAFLNILEDIDLEKEKVAGAFRQFEAVNKETGICLRSLARPEGAAAGHRQCLQMAGRGFAAASHRRNAGEHEPVARTHQADGKAARRFAGIFAHRTDHG
jgi:hypothetical protein